MRESCTAVVTDLSTRVRPDSVPQSLSEQWFASDQAVRVQVAYRCGAEGSEHVYDRVTASVMVLVDDHEIAANCWRVMEVAAPLVRYPESGGVYEIDVPGLVPDRLDPLGRFGARFLPDQWQSLVVELTAPLDPGSHTLDIRFVDDDGIIADATQRLEVVSVTGTVASFHHSEWIHVDALQAWSGVEAFDERHWDLIDKAVELAASAGVDTLFTPILTPPIDVDPTSPPLATQLVVVHRQGDRWSFDFDRLDRWSRIARRHGITHLEFSHLFCQGEVDRPADVYDADGNHLFGSHLPTEGYRDFLAILLPALDQWSRRHGWSDALYWHVSDEPRANQYTSYRKAVDMVRRTVPEATVIDAVDDPRFATVVDVPVTIYGHLLECEAAGLDGMWAYTSCASTFWEPNRHLGMPLTRLRALGLLLWWHHTPGLLHWALNFWFDQFSRYLVDPNADTSADLAFPSGDSSVIYPRIDGSLVPSLRLKVLAQLHEDVRLLRRVEDAVGRPTVVELIEHLAPGSTADLDHHYPLEPDFYRSLTANLLCLLKNIDGAIV